VRYTVPDQSRLSSVPLLENKSRDANRKFYAELKRAVSFALDSGTSSSPEPISIDCRHGVATALSLGSVNLGYVSQVMGLAQLSLRNARRCKVTVAENATVQTLDCTKWV